MQSVNSYLEDGNWVRGTTKHNLGAFMPCLSRRAFRCLALLWPGNSEGMCLSSQSEPMKDRAEAHRALTPHNEILRYFGRHFASTYVVLPNLIVHQPEDHCRLNLSGISQFLTQCYQEIPQDMNVDWRAFGKGHARVQEAKLQQPS